MTEKIAKINDKVKVHYKGTLSDGTVFDESYSSVPLEFVIGSSTIIPGFENGVTGMSIGEKKKITVIAEDAYGNWTEELVLEFNKENIPDDLDIEIGTILQLQLAEKQVVNVTVTEIKKDSVVFDANHHLAGQDLTFEIELLSIEQL